MRQQFVTTVSEIMDRDNRVVLLLGDIGVHGFREVFKKHPKRIYNVGICEQTMVGMAAGLAMAGFIPILHTIVPFLVERAYEQIKDDFGYQELKGNFVGVDVSESQPNLGYTHYTPYDTLILSHILNLKSFTPNTPQEFDSVFKDNYDKGLNYIRIK